jgi:hypothetical protein
MKQEQGESRYPVGTDGVGAEMVPLRVRERIGLENFRKWKKESEIEGMILKKFLKRRIC